jgi:hypothetical protein
MMSVVGPITSLALGGLFLLVAGRTSWAACWPAGSATAQSAE